MIRLRRRLMFWLMLILLLAALPLTLYAAPNTESTLNEYTPVHYIPAEVRGVVIIATVIAVISISALSYLLMRKRMEQDRVLWRVGLIFSFLCVVGIGIKWGMVLNEPPFDERYDDHRPILDNSMVAELVTEQQAFATSTGSPQPIFIRTGIYVQAYQFDSSNNVSVTGYVWQHYPLDLPENIHRGIVFPESSDITLTEEYNIQQGDTQLIGWLFNMTVRQRFDYHNFPFDQQRVWLRMWHENFEENVILVPDFDAYDDNWNPYLMPGLERQIVAEQLHPEMTYFDYQYNSYSTNFGFQNYQGQHEFPELYFNIVVRRSVIEAFIGYVIPITIVLVMLFLVQIIITQKAERREISGISTTEVISYCASLFFIALLSHLTMRSQINAAQVIYIEYFFFVTYVMIMLVTLNGVAFLTTDKIKLLEYKDNLYPKILFLPVTMGLLFFLSAIVLF